MSLDRHYQQRVYERWAPVYDRVYHKIFSDSHFNVAQRAAQCGRDILEIGVGTGLVLPHYPAECRVIGVDLSMHMLLEAVKKSRQGKLRPVHLIAQMDACRLGLPDAAFDAVAMPFVLPLIPEPERALDEALRVLRPGGEIVIVSKFGTETKAIARVEDWIAPMMGKIGWSSAFKIDLIRNWCRMQGNIHLVEVASMAPVGFFKLLRLKKDM